MSHARNQFVGLMAILNLLGAEALMASTTSAAIWTRSYACGNAAVTVKEQALGLYTYEAANARGNTLTIKNGTHYRDQSRASIYTFHKGDTDYKVKDLGKGKAELTTQIHGSPANTITCTK